jgi:hypothetical protein
MVRGATQKRKSRRINLMTRANVGVGAYKRAGDAATLSNVAKR